MGARETAEANVALKYDSQQAALDRAIAATQAGTAANEAGINEYGAKGRAAIGDVYNTLGGLLAANRTDSANALQQQVANVGRGYDVAEQVQRQAAEEGRSRLGDLAARLGQQPAQLQVQTGLESLIANLLGRSAQEKAAATGNLGTWAAQWDQILGQGINIGEQSRAKGLSDLEAAIARMLGENKVAGLKGETDLRGRIADVLAARQNDLVAMYNQLAQQEWENSFKQAQLDQDAAKANASLAMEQARLNLSAQGQAADNAYRAQQAAKSGVLSAKDLIAIANAEREYQDTRGDKAYARSADERDYQLRRMQALSGDSGPDGNQLLYDWQSKLSSQGTPPTDEMIQNQANFLARMGYPVEWFSGADTGMPGMAPIADPNMRNPNTGWQYMPFYGYTETRIGPGGATQYR